MTKQQNQLIIKMLKRKAKSCVSTVSKHCSLHGHELEIAEEAKYLGVIIRSTMKFTAHIHKKLMTANQQLDRYYQESTVLGFYQCQTACLQDSLCLPNLEYAVAARDPSSIKDIPDIEQPQDQAVRFIAGIKRRGGVEDARTRLGLIPLHNKRRRDQRLRLLIRILAKEEHHSSLSESYNEIMNQPTTTMTMKSQTCGIPATFRTSRTQYYNSLLPRTIRDLKGQSEPTVSCSTNPGLTPTANTIYTDSAYRTCTDEHRPD